MMGNREQAMFRELYEEIGLKQDDVTILLLAVIG